MKMNWYFIVCMALLSSCSPKLEQQLIGKWEIQSIYDQEQDVSEQHNPAQNRWITFFSDNSFKSGGDPYGDNSGKWAIDSSSAVLYLDSDAGAGDDSYWIISITKDQMNWQGTQSEFTKRFKVIMQKTESK